MTKTLQAALAPLLIISSFCNLSIFEYPLGQPQPYLSCLYTFVLWSYLTYFCYYSYYIDTWHNKFNDWLEIQNVITAITIILIHYFYSKELRLCLRELSIVDDTLETLGAPKKYQRLRSWIIRIIIGWILYIFYSIASHPYMRYLVLYLDVDDVDFIKISEIFLTYYPHLVNILSAMIWGTILRYISSRFHQVNDRLHVLCSDLFENNEDRRQNRRILVHQRITRAKDCKQYILIIM